MPTLREPARLPDRFYLVMRRVGTNETVRIPITAAEHAMSYEDCEQAVRDGGRLPAGDWEFNDGGGTVRLGGVWTFDGTASGDLEPGDAYYDVVAGRLIVNVPGGNSLLDLRSTHWEITRGTGNGLTVRPNPGNTKPGSVRIQDGVLTVKDLSLISADSEGR